MTLFPKKFRTSEKDAELAQLHANAAGKNNPFATINDLLGVQARGTDVDFKLPETNYGTISETEDGDITVDLTGARLNSTILIFHNAASEPSYPSTFKKSTLSGDYAPGEVNYIYVIYIDDDHQIYSVSQAAA
jgi:hypothetical protein